MQLNGTLKASFLLPAPMTWHSKSGRCHTIHSFTIFKHILRRFTRLSGPQLVPAPPILTWIWSLPVLVSIQLFAYGMLNVARPYTLWQNIRNQFILWRSVRMESSSLQAVSINVFISGALKAVNLRTAIEELAESLKFAGTLKDIKLVQALRTVQCLF